MLIKYTIFGIISIMNSWYFYRNHEISTEAVSRFLYFNIVYQML